MKKIGLFAFFILAIVWGCSSSPGTELSDTNVGHGIWSSEKLYALLPDGAKMAVCDFNDDYKTVDSLSSFLSDCQTKIMTYRGKHGYILRDENSQCRTVGSSYDMIYYDKEGAPVLRFRQRYFPSRDLTTQVVVLFENGTYKNAFSRSVNGPVSSLVESSDFVDYEPFLGENRVERYQKK